MEEEIDRELESDSAPRVVYSLRPGVRRAARGATHCSPVRSGLYAFFCLWTCMTWEMERSLGETTFFTCCCDPVVLRTTLRHSRGIEVRAAAGSALFAVTQVTRPQAGRCLRRRDRTVEAVCICIHPIVRRALDAETSSACTSAGPALPSRCTAS